MSKLDKILDHDSDLKERVKALMFEVIGDDHKRPQNNSEHHCNQMKKYLRKKVTEL